MPVLHHPMTRPQAVAEPPLLAVPKGQWKNFAPFYSFVQHKCLVFIILQLLALTSSKDYMNEAFLWEE